MSDSSTRNRLQQLQVLSLVVCGLGAFMFSPPNKVEMTPTEMAGKYPVQLCLGLDAKDSMVATEGWLDVSQTSAIELARQYVDLDLPAVIYTNIANDGMMQGVDEQTIADMIALADMGLKVIASGGVTTLEDIRRLKEVHDAHPNLTGVITGRAIYEGAFQVTEAVAIAGG